MLALLALVPSAITDYLNPEELLHALGTYALVGVALIIFAETGLLIGFFLPGDSLLFVTGMFVSQGFIPTPIAVVCLLLTAAAIIGNMVGYWIGRKAGAPLFSRQDSRIFRQEYVDKTYAFFAKHGNKAIVLARFVPIVRTFITAVAGVARMDYRSFVVYSAIGGVLWATGVTLMGYFLGSIPVVKDHIEIILLLVVVVSLVPMVVEFVRHRYFARPAVAATPTAQDD
ncbi:MAG: VTT domain-containing protein [Actinobacteria bacterium]|nr:VTT domain-containing protein [Actinomycetota bacterium]MCB9411751.1 VTT domain-containing protein [Actinomycetota bacterium]